MTQVQFCFLRVTISTVTGDHVTVALLHFDGRNLRIGHCFENVPKNIEGFSAIESKAMMLLKEASQKWTRIRRTATDLDDFFPVRSGLGASLAWTPVRIEETSNVQAHFEELGFAAWRTNFVSGLW